MKHDRLLYERTESWNPFGFLLNDVSRLYTRHFEQRMVPLRLTLAECKVIIYLSRNERANQTQLAELTETDSSTLVRIIDRMEKDSIIERHADVNDRRAHRLHLGPPALAVLLEILRISNRITDQVLVGVSRAEQFQLARLLERIHGNLSQLVTSTNDSDTTSAAHTTLPDNDPASRNEAGLSSGKRRPGLE
jgi:DNA-binding MarR family transcriptional regulator